VAACPACGKELPGEFPFCPHCGAPLTGDSREQRKTVTVLFCDLTGSTALGESTDPEALPALLARHYERVRGDCGVARREGRGSNGGAPRWEPLRVPVALVPMEEGSGGGDRAWLLATMPGGQQANRQSENEH
jgi:hypothetical protein